jgi:protein O-mannosyl-transferase
LSYYIAPLLNTSEPTDIAAPARATLLGGCAALAGGLVYLNALHNPFVYDDFHTVVDNPSLHSLANLPAIVLYAVTRPLVNLSYAIDYAAWGSGPFGFHLTSLLLHMLNVALLFVLAQRLVDDSREAVQGRYGVAAFGAAALFAVHPVMSEAVGYISGRSEVLCGSFFLAGLLCGRRWLRGGRSRWAVLTIAAWMAALASKEVAAMLPLVLWAYDRLFVQSSPAARRRRVIRIHLPLLGLAAVGGVVRLLVLALIEYPGQAVVHWSFLLVDLDVMRRSLLLLLLPHGQTIFHAISAIEGLQDLRLWLDVATVGALAVLAWWTRRTHPSVALGIVWFVLLLVPASLLILFDQGEPMTEHRLYLASAGLFIAAGAAVGMAVESVPRWRMAGAAILALAVTALGSQTVMRNRVWADPVLLWGESVRLAPDHPRPRLLLGEAFADIGQYDLAVQQFRMAIRLRPADVTGYVKLGRLYAAGGRLEEARTELARAAALDPGNPLVRQSIAAVEAARTHVDFTRR